MMSTELDGFRLQYAVAAEVTAQQEAPVRRPRAKRVLASLATLSATAVLATGCSSDGGSVDVEPVPGPYATTEVAPLPTETEPTPEETLTPSELPTTTEPAPTAPAIPSPQKGPFKAVYFQPQADKLANPDQTFPGVYKMVAEPGNPDGQTSWTSTELCGRQNAGNFLEQPSTSTITSIVAYSLGRKGPQYLFNELSPEQRKQFNYVFVVDPGNKDDLTGPCEKSDDEIGMTNWLYQSAANRLVIMAGARTAENDYQALYETYIQNIAGTRVESQVIICGNSALGHQEIWNRSQGLVRRIGEGKRPITSTNDCPTGWVRFHPQR